LHSAHSVRASPCFSPLGLRKNHDEATFLHFLLMLLLFSLLFSDFILALRGISFVGEGI
jgi:hypothetical protein